MPDKIGRLVPNVYPRFGRGLFGIGEGQMRSDDLVHNGSWFNADGVKLCWGDLSIKDLMTIRDGLQGDEVFAICGEHDSFWELHPQFARGKNVDVDMSRPGREWLKGHAWYVIVRGHVYSQHGVSELRGLDFEPLTPEKLKDIFG